VRIAREAIRVAVVGGDHKSLMRTVKPGQTVGTMWVIDSGLKPSEQVVVEGTQRLRKEPSLLPGRTTFRGGN